MLPPAERYVLLGLRLGRHDEEVVDAYFGPPELALAVEREPLAHPSALAEAADELLAELEDGWLLDQVEGLRAYASMLAGEPLSYADEAEAFYGVRPSFTDEAVFEAAHERLEELLPGDGSIVARHEAWERSIRVSSEQLQQALGPVIDEARAHARRFVELPPGEIVDLEFVRDKPWIASCDYLGNLRSRITVNADVPRSAAELVRLAIHETYPGHHAESSCKEELLVRDRGLLEAAIALVPTPEILVSEGIAELAPELLLDSAGCAAFEAVLSRAGVKVDLAHAVAIEQAAEPCRWAEVNAALMLHERGIGQAEVQEYLERWALVSPEVASHLVRFVTENSRTYILTYSAGRGLCRAYVGGDPTRFRRLLTEQVRVGELLEASRG